jgi:hypothetical protein
MFHHLVSHNHDIEKLVEVGYAVGFDDGFLIIRDVPYLDQNLELAIGAFVSKIVAIDADHVRQDDHQVFFAGSAPYGLDGAPIPNLGGGSATLALGPTCSDIVVERSFSNKPPTRPYHDAFEKIENYIALISGPAMERFPGTTPMTFRMADELRSNSVFKFQDTLTSRAEIADLSAKLRDDIILIIGAGGTGGYILDFLAKCPVREIRVYDGDDFHVHNAFRSPGALDPKDLGRPKAEVCERRYSSFRSGITGSVRMIYSDGLDQLQDVTFAFVCVDKGDSRSQIHELLIDHRVPFIDVCMGLRRKNGFLTGMLRTTMFQPGEADRVSAAGWVPLAEDPDDEYKTSIQTAELNALNASIAVVRYKQYRGFYVDDSNWANHLFSASDGLTAAEAAPDAV